MNNKNNNKLYFKNYIKRTSTNWTNFISFEPLAQAVITKKMITRIGMTDIFRRSKTYGTNMIFIYDFIINNNIIFIWKN